jgi:cell shape-determining protein MreD
MIYILFIFLIPLDFNKYYFLIISFIIGLIIDIFSNSGGVHASATLTIAYFRLTTLNIVQNNNEFDHILFNIKKLNFIQATVYIFSLVFIHHSIIYCIEYYKTDSFINLFGKIMQATLFSGIIISFILQLLITERK